ncbi:MAG: PEP-CTERM sorting domain-containing protein [Planctomycetaceae bacterium]|jgi:hypothetical protein|nr:PEP-CTERM sorting domain-containing protein [Planctomycetaceae bacterium]
MNTIKITSIVALMTVAAFASYAKADTLHYDKQEGMLLDHRFEYYDNITGQNSYWEYTSAFKANSDTLGDTFRLFCVDQHTHTSSTFDSKFGQTYYTDALNSESMTLYNQTQKDALNSLFSHVYSTVFDTNGDYINKSSVGAFVYQMAVWEIVHEQSGVYAIDSGTFGVKSAKTGSADDIDFYNSAVGLANSWFDAIAGNVNWDLIGYDTVTNYDLTIYVAEGGKDISQTFISVVNTEDAATPEPASMLIFGLGIAGLGLARRKFVTK